MIPRLSAPVRRVVSSVLVYRHGVGGSKVIGDLLFLECRHRQFSRGPLPEAVRCYKCVLDTLKEAAHG